MKRIFAAIVLTLLILLLCACGHAVTSRSIQHIQSAMADIEANLNSGNTEIALQKSESFLREWEATHGNLCLFLQHAQLDSLEKIIAVLPYYIDQEHIVQACAHCQTAQAIAEHILKTEQISLENIL